jgi:hypothetical protein
VSVVLLVFALTRSTWRAWTTGRVPWRGRTYALDELRAAHRAAAAREREAARARATALGRVTWRR